MQITVMSLVAEEHMAQILNYTHIPGNTMPPVAFDYDRLQTPLLSTKKRSEKSLNNTWYLLFPFMNIQIKIM